MKLDTLEGLEVVSVRDAARTAGIDHRTLCNRLAESGIPIIKVGRRKRGLMLAHFQAWLVANAARAA